MAFDHAIAHWSSHADAQAETAPATVLAAELRDMARVQINAPHTARRLLEIRRGPPRRLFAAHARSATSQTIAPKPESYAVYHGPASRDASAASILFHRRPKFVPRFRGQVVGRRHHPSTGFAWLPAIIERLPAIPREHDPWYTPPPPL